ncbi:hypothetical protein ACFX13_038197 [Malus domestica]
MGRKTKETSAAVGEAEPQQTQPLHETTAERRKKQKNKDEEEAQLSSNPKRLLLRKKTQILLTRRRRRSTRNPKRRKNPNTIRSHRKLAMPTKENLETRLWQLLGKMQRKTNTSH